MDKKANKVFWTVFTGFCISTVLLLQVTGMLNLSEMGSAENAILTGFLLLTGAVIRFWFSRNPTEVKRKFKL